MQNAFDRWLGETVVIMISPVDERRDVEDQIVRRVLLQIARGAYREGETLPPPQSVARDLLVNPRRVQAAYRRLSSNRLVVQVKGQGYLIQPDAREEARTRLVDCFCDRLHASLTELREVGCSTAQLQAAIDTVLRKER